MQAVSTLKWFTLFLLISSITYGQPPCTDYSEATLIGDTVCLGAAANVRVLNTTLGKSYQAYEGTKAVGAVVTSSGGTIVLNIPNLEIGTHTIGLRPTDVVCNTLSGGVATVKVNQGADVSIPVKGDTICYNADSANITLYNTQTDVQYQATLNGTAVSRVKNGNGGTIVLRVSRSSLSLDGTPFKIKAFSSGCGTLYLTHTAAVEMLPVIDPFFFELTATTPVCASEPLVKITANHVTPNNTYYVYINDTVVKTETTKEGQTQLDLIFPTKSFGIGTTKVTVQTTLVFPCMVTRQERSIDITVNPIPGPPFALKKDTLMANANDHNVPVVFQYSVPGLSYTLSHLDTNSMQMFFSNIAHDTLPIPISFLSPDTNRIKISTVTAGCVERPFADTVIIIVKPSIVNSINTTDARYISQIGPNPLSNTLYIKLLKQDVYWLRIRDAFGNLVHEETLNTLEINLSTHWPAGVYYLEIEGDGFKELRKLIK